MAAVTPIADGAPSVLGASVRRFHGTGGSNADATLTTPTVPQGSTWEVQYATAAYSGSPTQAGVTFGIVSGLGSGYDCTLSTGSANTKLTAYTPGQLIVLLPGDALVVTALAGGSGQTAAIVVVVKQR
jgi:hypothetical protein